MQKLEDIKDFTDIIEFEDNGYVFKKDNRARASLNKTLETNYRAVYRQASEYDRQWKAGDISWCGEQFHAITEKGKLLSFYNSEWGGVDSKEIKA